MFPLNSFLIKADQKVNDSTIKDPLLSLFSFIIKAINFKTKPTNWLALFVVGLCIIVINPKAHADCGVPTSVSSTYNPVTNVLTVTVNWTWNDPNNKAISAAVFADLNGDGNTPGPTDKPSTWLAPGLTTPSDEFLGQLATSSIEGVATSSLPFSDATDTGIASGLAGFTTSTPRVLFPYGLADAKIPPLSGTFTLTYTNVTVAPSHICVILYDIHTKDNQTTIKDLNGKHSPVSADNNTTADERNEDNSVEEGYNPGGGNETVSCTDPEGSINFDYVDVELVKAVSNPTPIVGDVVTFTLTVQNNDASAAVTIPATGIDVSDILPNGYDYVAGTIGFNAGATGATISASAVGDPMLTWTINQLDPGESVTLTFNATVLATGGGISHNNVAQVTDHNEDDMDSLPNDGTGDDYDEEAVTPVACAYTADAGSPQTVCASSPDVTLGGSIGGGAVSGTWSGGGGSFNPDNTTLNAVYTPSGIEVTSGSVTLTLTTDDPAGSCPAATDQVTMTFNPACSLNPTISQIDEDGDGTPDIFDPCSCNDPLNIMGGGGNVTLFHDFIVVSMTATGETWEITALNSGSMFENDGVTPIVPSSPNAQLAETSPGSGVYRIDLWHLPGIGFDADVSRTAGGPALTLNANDTCAPCAQIPTLGQWGMIFLSLLILTFGVVALRRHEPAMVMAGQGSSASSDQSRLPFNKAAFGKMLGFVMMGLAVVFAVAIFAFGYEMTAADAPGSLVAGPLLAYLLHLVFPIKNNE